MPFWGRCITGNEPASARKWKPRSWPSTLGLMANLVGIHLMGGQVQTGFGTRNPLAIPSQAFRTRDSYFLTVISGRKLWANFCRALGRPGWIDDENLCRNEYRVTNRLDVERMIEEITVTRTTREWIEIFEAHDVPAGPINTIEEMFQNPLVDALGLITTTDHATAGPVKLQTPPFLFSRTPAEVRLPPPVLGEHTSRVLNQCGLSSDEIELLRKSEVIFGP